MVLWSRNSDRTGERYWHAAIACLIAAAGMAVAARAGSSAILAITGLSLTAFGVSAAKPPLWSLPTTFFGGTAAAASIGLINSLGTLGGFAGPYMIGCNQWDQRAFQSRTLSGWRYADRVRRHHPHHASRTARRTDQDFQPERRSDMPHASNDSENAN
jgi:hypothetical protein